MTAQLANPVRRRAIGVLMAPAFVIGAMVAALAPPADAATAQISNVRLTALATTTATIAWDTDIASDTQVAYGADHGVRLADHPQHGEGDRAHREPHRARPPTGPTTTRSAAGTPRATWRPRRDRTFTTRSVPHGRRLRPTRRTPTTSTSRGSRPPRAAGWCRCRPTSAPSTRAVARRSFQLAIYTANGSAPGTLVASSATGTLVANSWNTVPISATLAPNTSYYFAYNTNGAQRWRQQPPVHQRRHERMADRRAAVRHLADQPSARSPARPATFSLYASFASDVTPPTVSVTAPADGLDRVGGRDHVAANAADDSAVASVQFKVDGANLGAPDTTAPYTPAGTPGSARRPADAHGGRHRHGRAHDDERPGRRRR